MKKLAYIILCMILTACSEDMVTPADPAAGHAMSFQVNVSEQPLTRGQVLDVEDNFVTRDFKAGDAFGMFIIDGDGDFVSLIDGKNAKNIKLTTPDGKAWAIDSDIKEVVHKLGYRYVAYFPYSEDFNNCSSTDDIQRLLTAPPYDQSAREATDWMYTEPTTPQTNAITILTFRHKYAKIDIYNSFTQDHNCDWAAKYKFTKTTDDDNVEHYRYILDTEGSQPLAISGTYTIGNHLTGIKELSYRCDGIEVQNGRHSIVYTYKMDERCAVDLGLPSGIKWSPINLGTETGTYMDEAEIANATRYLGKRLAWGELFEKDTYSYATYINDPYEENKKSLLPTDITGTVYDPVRQYWGGHWTLPSRDDMQELIDNTEVAGIETVASEELGKTVRKITLRSRINGKEITMLTNGYVYNSTVTNNTLLYYLSATLSNYAYCTLLHYKTSMTRMSNYRYMGYSIRPVLKELHIYTEAEKKDIMKRHIDELAVDLGIRKTVTETVGGVEQEVTYKLLWSPANYGTEAKTELNSYNRAPVNEDAFIAKCMGNPGMRLAWGDTEERAKFSYTDYMASPIAAKYAYDNTANDLDARDLQPEDDIVQLNWPEGWYIPTAKDLELLYKNTTITKETINNRTWFRLTGKNGYKENSILVPATEYIDNKENTEKWGSNAYLQSSTIGTKGGNQAKPYTTYTLQLSGSTTGKMLPTAGRPTGFMLRPVKYVRVE